MMKSIRNLVLILVVASMCSSCGLSIGPDHYNWGATVCEPNGGLLKVERSFWRGAIVTCNNGMQVDHPTWRIYDEQEESISEK